MLIPLDFLIEKFRMNIRGAVHVGAHNYEEKNIYEKLKIENIFLIEPSKRCERVLLEKTSKSDNVELWIGAAGSIAGNGIMNTEERNGGQSNSLLEPFLHTVYYPDIIFNGREEVRIDTLDYIIGASGKYNFINCDAQGFELEIFKGATSLLRNDIDYIYCEINKEPLYRNCALVGQIDDFLKVYDFERVETKWTNQGWGDALYIKTISR